jgi:hypothetical protein
MKKRIRFPICLMTLLALSCYKGNGLSPAAPEPESGIQGTVRFKGAWPDSTDQVWVVVSKTYPEDITTLEACYQFVYEGFTRGTIIVGDTIPNFIREYEYQFKIQPGSYEFLLVVWIPRGNLFGLKELGAYYGNTVHPTLPAPVDVYPGVVTDHIDIQADFSNIDREMPFFKRKKTR